MVTPRVLRGSKEEISKILRGLQGEFHEVIIFEEEDMPTSDASPESIDFFDAMGPFLVDVQDVDDTREAIYDRMAGE